MITGLLKRAKYSIDYFKFKMKYAKNKQLHAQHLNTIIELYNALESLSSDKPAVLIKDLTAALYAELLFKFKNPVLAQRKLDHYITYHHLNIEYATEAVEDIIIQSKDYLKNPERTLAQLDDAYTLAKTDIQRILNFNQLWH